MQQLLYVIRFMDDVSETYWIYLNAYIGNRCSSGVFADAVAWTCDPLS